MVPSSWPLSAGLPPTTGAREIWSCRSDSSSQRQRLHEVGSGPTPLRPGAEAARLSRLTRTSKSCATRTRRCRRSASIRTGSMGAASAPSTCAIVAQAVPLMRRMMSPGCSVPCRSAGPPGTRMATVGCPSKRSTSMPSVPSRPRESEAWHRVTQRHDTEARPWWVGVGHSMYVAIARVAAASRKHSHSQQKQQAWAQSGMAGADGKRHACSA